MLQIPLVQSAGISSELNNCAVRRKSSPFQRFEPNNKSHKWRFGFIVISVVKLSINKEKVIMQHK